MSIAARVAAIGWALALVMGAALWVQSARHASATDQVRRSAAALEACRSTAHAWEATTRDLRDRLSVEVEARRADRERDQAAVIAAEAAQRDADRTLRAWLDRYAAATRSAECAAIERMVVCEVAP